MIDENKVNFLLHSIKHHIEELHNLGVNVYLDSYHTPALTITRIRKGDVVYAIINKEIRP
jgi:hypothetical protein